MTRTRVAAVLACIVMVLVAAAPLVSGGDHLVAKGGHGPKGSAATWSFQPEFFGEWRATIVNSGLRWIVLDVYDNSTGMPDLISHQRIRFADYDAYPTGLVYSDPVLLAKGRLYEVTATPNGPKDSYAVVTDNMPGNNAPIPSFVCCISGFTLAVDASSSQDLDGWIVAYEWDWGDGTWGTGVIAEHIYSAGGVYDVNLTVIDNLGASACTVVTVFVWGPTVPVASFTLTTSGLTVEVDASDSYDPNGEIVLYSWDWGDGSTGTGVLASHTYAMEGLYAITLTVMDNDGLTSSVTFSPIVHDTVPTAVYAKAWITNDIKVTVVGVSRTDVPWDHIMVQLSDGTNIAQWKTYTADLDGGSATTMNYSSLSLGSVTVCLHVADIGGNGFVSSGDFFYLFTYGGAPGFTPGITHEFDLIYTPTGEYIGTGIAFVP